MATRPLEKAGAVWAEAVGNKRPLLPALLALLLTNVGSRCSCPGLAGSRREILKMPRPPRSRHRFCCQGQALRLGLRRGPARAIAAP